MQFFCLGCAFYVCGLANELQMAKYERCEPLFFLRLVPATLIEKEKEGQKKRCISLEWIRIVWVFYWMARVCVTSAGWNVWWGQTYFIRTFGTYDCWFSLPQKIYFVADVILKEFINGNKNGAEIWFHG